MRYVLLYIIAALAFVSCGTGGGSRGLSTVEPNSEGVTYLLYFHGKQRCVTCNAIEQHTKAVVDSLADERVVMKIIDISQRDNEVIADKYEVTWSSLILDRDGSVVNLTNMGFGYAKNQPQIFKKKLVEAIKAAAR